MIDKAEARRYLTPRRRGGMRSALVTRCGLLVVVGALLLGGCSRGATSTPLPERVAKYWELKQSKRWEEVYDGYLDPELKGKISKAAFLRKRLLAFDILGFTVGEPKESGDEATLEVVNDVNIPMRGPGGKVQMTHETVTTEERWVRRDGTWFIRLPE